MCGIVGSVALRQGIAPPSIDDLRAMIGAIRHRGPDEFGVYRDERAGLGHARLSIIDLATGQQPLSNEDGTIWIVFNGEIFNYVELRAELETPGRPGVMTPFGASTGNSPSRCGTRFAGSWCWPGIAWACAPSISASTVGGSGSPAR
jgi:hypothetical protein